MHSTETALLSALADSIHGIKPSINTELADEIYSEALSQGVLPLIYNKNVYTEKDFSRQVLSLGLRTVNIEKQHAFLHKILTDNAIPYVILKGCASGSYYPNPELRSYGDVDFLISPENADKTKSVLLSAGFIDMKHGNEIHSIFSFQGIRFEMHILPPGIPSGFGGIQIKSYFDDIFISSRNLDIDFGKMCIPSPFHHGLILLLHTAHHLTAEGIGLRHLCDWAVFAESFTEEEFCSTFKNKLETVGLWDFAKILCALSSRYLHCKEFSFTKDIDCDFTLELIKDIITGGNFGQKLPSRSHEALLVSENRFNQSHSKLSNFVTSANRIVYNHWKVSKKIKILLPIGWLFFGGRYIIRSLSGKRPKIEIQHTINSAEYRIRLYKNFHLFETGVNNGK